MNMTKVLGLAAVGALLVLAAPKCAGTAGTITVGTIAIGGIGAAGEIGALLCCMSANGLAVRACFLRARMLHETRAPAMR